MVRGIGFANYLEISKHIKTKVNVVKDNDGNHENNIKKYAKKYDEWKDEISFFSSSDNDLNSLEPVMIDSNSANEEILDVYAQVALSTRTYNKYTKEIDLKSKKMFLRDWYSDPDGSGAKKVDTAVRIFDSDTEINFPEYLEEALTFE